jgi:hypothetical protein
MNKKIIKEEIIFDDKQSCLLTAELLALLNMKIIQSEADLKEWLATIDKITYTEEK